MNQPPLVQLTFAILLGFIGALLALFCAKIGDWPGWFHRWRPVRCRTGSDVCRAVCLALLANLYYRRIDRNSPASDVV